MIHHTTGLAPAAVHPRRNDHAAAPQSPTSRPEAPGQAAKAAIREAGEAGADLPANIQGKVASAIARGIDPATVFAALTATDPAPADDQSAPANDLPTDPPAAA